MNNTTIDKLVKLAGTDYDRRRKLTTTQIRSIKSETPARTPSSLIIFAVHGFLAPPLLTLKNNGSIVS